MAASIEVDKRLAAQRLDDQHIHVPDAPIDRAQPHVLRPDADLQLALISAQLDGDGEASRFDHPAAVADPFSSALQDIHSRRADKARDVDVRRFLIDLLGRSHLP